MRALATITFAILAAAALAGCVAGGAVAQARDSFDTANDRGRAWNEDAILVSLIALEVPDAENATREIEAELQEDSDVAAYRDTILGMVRALVADGDSNPGDGFAPAWGYLFVSKEGFHVVVVDAGGATTFDEDFDLPGMDEALDAGHMPQTRGLDGSWAIDSQEAARIASQHNKAYAALVGSSLATASTELSLGKDGPEWSMVLAAPDQPAAFVQVDATTGKVLRSWPESDVTPPTIGPGPGPQPTPDVPPQEADEFQGSLTVAVSEADEESFTVRYDGHRHMRLVLEARDSFGTLDLRATVTDPAGDEHDMEITGIGIFGSTRDSIDVEPMQGSWEVTVWIGDSVQQDYAFYWCTDGDTQGDDADGNLACEEMGIGNKSPVSPGVAGAIARFLSP